MTALVFERFLSTPEMLAVFSETSVLQSMLDVEAALARAQAALGVIPDAAARVIAACCQTDPLDLEAIVNASGRAGSLAIPLVKHLTAAVAKVDANAAGFVHWGSTSQDVIDTAMSLLSRRALALIDRDLRSLIDSLLTLAERHAHTPVLARTLMQAAQVVSVGFKLLAWTAPLQRCRERLHEISKTALQLQLGGAVGTLAVMGEKGDAVAQQMAADLQLVWPGGAWHTQRDEAVTLACQVGVLCGALGKVAKDMSLMSQAEVGELNEPSGDGRGGSSAMPHKRNPVASMVALAAALRAPQRVAALLAAMVQEHERGLGNWQAELAETAGLYLSAHGALKALADAAQQGLEVHAERMRANIDALNGLVFAEAAAKVFAVQIGKAQAHALLETLSAQVTSRGAHLHGLCLAVLQSDNRLRGRVSTAEIDTAFNADLAAQAAARAAAPQLVALRRAASSFELLQHSATSPARSG
jgi:3-carboxy-cis,cis-muconate cycloisomerase